MNDLYYIPNKIICSYWKKALKDNLYNDNCLLVTTPGFKRRGIVDEVSELFERNRLYVHDRIVANPEIHEVAKWIDWYKEKEIKYIIAVGGGSSIDVAKAFSFFLSSNCSIGILEYFNEKKKLISYSSCFPIIAIPTTSGSGSEVTPFATFWDKYKKKKYSLSDDALRPKIAILDPQLTVTLDYKSSLISALDVISHAFESIWNRNANSFSILNATNSLSLVFRSLPELKGNSNDISLRSDIQIASCLSGMAISTTKTALAHSISYPLTAHFGIPHGLASSFTLPSIFKYNLVVDDGRLAQLSKSLGYESLMNFESFLKDLFLNLGIHKLINSYLPSEPKWVEDLSDEMYTPERAKNNLRSPNRGDIKSIVYQSIKK